MKTALGKTAEGSIVTIEEFSVGTGSGIAGSLSAKESYVVAKHNYQSSLNGTGHTLLVRLEPLDTRRWGNSLHLPTYSKWEKSSTIPEYLENSYVFMDPLLLSMVKPLKIKCSSTYGTVYDCETEQRFFVPSLGDLGSSRKDGDAFSDAVLKVIRSKVTGSFWLRSMTTADDDDGDSIAAAYTARAKDTESAPYFSFTARETDDSYAVLPCFAVLDSAVVDENGMLLGNHTPELSSHYFGTESTHNKWSAFRVSYTVHDEDGDAMTVTELLNGSAVRTYTPTDGKTCYFSVTESMLEALDETIDHILTVQVTDGAAQSEKSYRFRKAKGHVYIVYIGKIKGNGDGTGYYWTERHVLHNAADDTAPFVLEPELTLEENDPGSFSFTVPSSNPWYDQIALKTAVIAVEEDGNEIFMGHVTEWNKTFDLDMEVTCEGELSYLEDRDCIIEEKTYTATEFMTLAVTADSRFAQEGKAFNLGTVTKERTGTDKDDKETRTITDCWSVAKDYLADKYGGYLRLRKTVKMENGVQVYRRYLDYLDMPPDRTDQVIQFGVNLLDLSYDLKANDIVNSIIVIGYETTGWFIFSTTNEIRVEVKNEASIKEFGLCQRYMTVDGTKSTKESLQKKGEEELKKHTDQFTGSLTVNAADLADTGVDTDRLGFLKQTRIVSEVHGLANWVLCTKEVIPLDAPEEKEFTFGETSQKLSALQAKNFGTAGKAWNAIQSTIRYVKNGG